MDKDLKAVLIACAAVLAVFSPAIIGAVAFIATRA